MLIEQISSRHDLNKVVIASEEELKLDKSPEWSFLLENVQQILTGLYRPSVLKTTISEIL